MASRPGNVAPVASSEGKFGIFTLPHAPAKIAYHFYEVPQRDLPVIMLSNSLSSTFKVLWKEFVEHFRDSYSIIMYDQRFHGESPLSEGFDYYGKGLTFEELADDAAAILDHLGIARIHAFVGLSMGATTGLFFKARHSARVGKIVAAGSGLKSAPPGAEDVFEARVKIATDGQDGMAKLAPSTLERWFPGEPGRRFLDTHSGRRDELLEMLRDAKPEGFVACIRALQNFDLTGPLEKIKERGDSKDVLLVIGEMDGVLPDANKSMAKISDSNVAIIPESGHIMNIQKAGEFNVLVDKFITP
ncbi:Alpha/Beta hydrolase protein [Lipomyces kononenkoae]|uniref:Alpha/Beta hydrolase protein n=1 Tax=Lipomyces kononenkoae TaxID=34357 RepID=A0ACC3T1M0_LIPKO